MSRVHVADSVHGLFSKKNGTLRAWVLIFAVLFLAVIASGYTHQRAPFASAEVQFTDTSEHGLAIVPASCPSPPYAEDYVGQCTDPSTPPPHGSTYCSVRTVPTVINSGDPATIYWIGPQTEVVGYATFTYIGGSITPSIGVVGQSGSQAISPSPTVTTTYTYSGTWSQYWPGVYQIVPFTCDATIQVASITCTDPNSHPELALGHCACNSGYTYQNGQCVLGSCPVGYTADQYNRCIFTSCPAGYTQQGTTCVPNGTSCPNSCSASGNVVDCNGNLITTCANGCLTGVCLAPASPSVTFTVLPLLVQSGHTVNVTWTSQNVDACTVKSTNNDSWTGLSSTASTCTHNGQSCVSAAITSQTVFTLRCTKGTNVITQSATVNIIPQFCEPGAPGCN